jgi:hypothetical protein
MSDAKHAVPARKQQLAARVLADVPPLTESAEWCMVHLRRAGNLEETLRVVTDPDAEMHSRVLALEDLRELRDRITDVIELYS